GTVLDILHLCGNVETVGGGAALFCAASGKLGCVHGNSGWFHGAGAVPRRGGVAGDNVSVGGVEEGIGVIVQRAGYWSGSAEGSGSNTDPSCFWRFLLGRLALGCLNVPAL